MSERQGLEEFRIHVGDAVLGELRRRIAATRWPPRTFADDWRTGPPQTYLEELLRYWGDEFDWRAQQARLEQWPHFRVRIEDFRVHFVHVRAAASAERRLPLLLLHGWPNTFADFAKLIPRLAHRFDLVVPSLPGYGYSEIPTREWAFRDVPEVMHRLMTHVLGYPRYGVHGSDIGASITARLAVEHPESVAGIHLTSVPGKPLPESDDLTDAERTYLAESERWEQEAAGYSIMQETRPTTLAYALHDSPAGLAAWIVEKLREWSDCGGELERRWTKDEVCTLLTIYWATGTIGPSFRAYFDSWNDPEPKPWRDVDVPAGFAIFPRDIVPPPRERAERRWNVVRWTEATSGGHFPAVEEPELLAAEIASFFSEIWSPGR